MNKPIGIPEGKPDMGLSDGGHMLVECKRCKWPLADLWVTSPDLDVTTPVNVQCWRCDEYTKVEVVGGFHPGHPAYNEELLYSKIVDFKFEDEVYLLTVKGDNVSKNAS